MKTIDKLVEGLGQESMAWHFVWLRAFSVGVRQTRLLANFLVTEMVSVGTMDKDLQVPTSTRCPCSCEIWLWRYAHLRTVAWNRPRCHLDSVSSDNNRVRLRLLPVLATMIPTGRTTGIAKPNSTRMLEYVKDLFL